MKVTFAKDERPTSNLPNLNIFSFSFYALIFCLTLDFGLISLWDFEKSK